MYFLQISISCNNEAKIYAKIRMEAQKLAQGL